MSFADEVKRAQEAQEQARRQDNQKRQGETNAQAEREGLRASIGREAYAALVGGGAPLLALCKTDYVYSKKYRQAHVAGHDWIADGVWFDETNYGDGLTRSIFLCADGSVLRGTESPLILERAGLLDSADFKDSQGKWKYNRIRGHVAVAVDADTRGFEYGNYALDALRNDLMKHAASRVAAFMNSAKKSTTGVSLTHPRAVQDF